MKNISALNHFMLAYYNENYDSYHKTLLSALKIFCDLEPHERALDLKANLQYLSEIFLSRDATEYNKLTLPFHRDLSETKIKFMVEFLNSEFELP